MERQVHPNNFWLAGLLLLAARSVLIWFVLPLAYAYWVVAGRELRAKGMTRATFLGWVDLNLIAFLQRGPFRLICRRWRQPWVPASEMVGVSYRYVPFN